MTNQPTPRSTILLLAALGAVFVLGSGALAWRVISLASSQQAVAGQVSGASEELAAGKFQLGQQLPDFTVVDGEGKAFRLNEAINGKQFVVVNFHHPDCPCAANCGRLINEMGAAGYDDVAVIGIMSTDTRDARVLEALGYQQQDGTVTFPVYFDHDGSVRGALGATRTPEMWVLDKDGTIAFYGAPENTLFPGSPGHRFLLREAIDALRLGNAPEIRRFDPIGCPIGG